MVAIAFGHRAYYLNELARMATPQEVAAVPDLRDVAGVSFTTHDTFFALETRWVTLFPAQFPSQLDRRDHGQLCRCRPDQKHRCERPTTINIPLAAEQIAAQHRRRQANRASRGPLRRGRTDFFTHRIPPRGGPLSGALGNTAPIRAQAALGGRYAHRLGDRHQLGYSPGGGLHHARERAARHQLGGSNGKPTGTADRVSQRI